MIRINLVSIFVSDQSKALDFYTRVLGFEKNQDIPFGEEDDAPRWLTVNAPGDSDGVQLVLEPNSNPVASTFQGDVYEQGIPATSFEVDDLAGEFARLKGLGVRFTQAPTKGNSQTGEPPIAVLDDGCGNLICLTQR